MFTKRDVVSSNHQVLGNCVQSLQVLVVVLERLSQLCIGEEINHIATLPSMVPPEVACRHSGCHRALP